MLNKSKRIAPTRMRTAAAISSSQVSEGSMRLSRDSGVAMLSLWPGPCKTILQSLGVTP